MTHFPTRCAHLSTWSIDQVFQDLPLGCKLFPAFWRVVAQILSMSPALCRPTPHQEPRAIKTAQNSNDSKNLWTRKRELRGKRCKHTVFILLQLLREDWSISWRLSCGNLKLWHLRIINPDPGLPDYCTCAYACLCTCALSHTRSLPLPGFQGQQNHSYLLPLPSSPQGSLRKQQELWGKQLRLSRRWHHPPAQKGLSRANGRHGCWPMEAGSCGIRGVFPWTGGGGSALGGLAGGNRCTEPAASFPSSVQMVRNQALSGAILPGQQGYLTSKQGEGSILNRPVLCSALNTVQRQE